MASATVLVPDATWPVAAGAAIGLLLGPGATPIACCLAQGIGLWLLVRKLEVEAEPGATV